MSRGLGAVQERLVYMLVETYNRGMPLSEVYRRMEGDRSNVRRAIRGLLRRELVEEYSTQEGDGHETRYLRLTFGGFWQFGWLMSSHPLPFCWPLPPGGPSITPWDNRRLGLAYLD